MLVCIEISARRHTVGGRGRRRVRETLPYDERVRTEHARARIAVISLHTSPLDQPGSGDAGGMNVEVREVATRLADRGVAVDVFTRCAGRGVPEIELLGPLTRVVQVPAGPCAGVDKLQLPELVVQFAEEVARRGEALGPYDLVHGHYWLSGGGGLLAARRWGVPLVLSFHTLAEVKDLALADLEQREPSVRGAGERRAIRAADRVVVPTASEAHHLVELYGARPARLRVIPPGVDGSVFFARPRAEARRRLGLGSGPVVLFVGRLQELKGPELAIRAFAEAMRRDPDGMARAELVLVGGPSGPGAEGILPMLEHVAVLEAATDHVRFVTAQPHEEMPWVYSAADLLVVPSRTESFGLSALEAQACGVPVVGARVGGLTVSVRDGASGYLLDPRDPKAYAERALAILSSPELAARLSDGAVAHASAFPWERTVDDLLAVYAEFVPALEAAAAS